MHDQDRNVVLFLHPGPVHRGQSGSPGVDQRLRTCERRNSALAPLRQLPGPVETTPQPPRRANEADAGRLGPVGYSSISLRSPLHSVWNVPSRSTRLYVWAPKKSRWPWMRFAGSSAARTPS